MYTKWHTSMQVYNMQNTSPKKKAPNIVTAYHFQCCCVNRLGGGDALIPGLGVLLTLLHGARGVSGAHDHQPQWEVHGLRLRGVETGG